MATSAGQTDMGDEKSNEAISLHLCKVLDMMGYSRQMIQFRIQAYQELASIINKNTNDSAKCVVSGSKGEGLTAPFESDIDIIYLYQDVVCVEEGFVHPVPSYNSIFTFRPTYIFPGYNILTLYNLGPGRPESLRPSLLHSPDGQTIISSTAHAEYLLTWERTRATSEQTIHGRSGPAACLSVLKLDIDRVYSIPSVSTSVLTRWLQRPRQYEWPPIDLQQRIAEMRGNFVAKGCKLSPYEQHEWRQCFNEAELLLVHSFEETPTKLYILLKIINKEVLRPFDSEQLLTSYVMKNIVFWLVEGNPSESFQPKYLINCLINALCMLAESLRATSLPYFMIPARNLLHPGMKTKVRDNLLQRVQCLIKEGPRMLYRCQTLVYTTRMLHSELSAYGAKRDELEMLHLQWKNYHYKMRKQGMSREDINNDGVFGALGRRQTELVYSTWPPHLQKDLDKCEKEWDCLAVILG